MIKNSNSGKNTNALSFLNLYNILLTDRTK